MSGLQELGDDLHLLAAALRSSPDTNPRAFEQASERLRAEQAQESAAGREALARQLQLPLSLVEPWLEDTLELLNGDQVETARRREAAERLTAISWALGPLPDDWPPRKEQIAKHGWQDWRSET